MKTILNPLFASLLVIFISAKVVQSQSAIGQLESISGQKINTSSVSSPSMSNMVGGAIMQGLISNIFAPVDTKQQEAEAAAKAQAELIKQQQIAAEKAEQKRIKDSTDLAHHNKMMQLYQPLSGTQNTELKPLPLPAPALLRTADVDKAIKTKPVPPLAESVPEKAKESHEYIEIGQDLVLEMVPPGWVGYGLKAGINLCFEDLKAAVDVYNGKPCPSTSTMITNALQKTAEGIIDDKAMHFAKYIGIKSGFKPLNIHNAVKTYEWATEAVDRFKEGYQFGTDIQKIW
ncbi:MAG: hypothetical protein HGB12_18030 [Bacteroidetes bacterium]|nr:hypothetical protein [Bacteroidota bacterium]